MNFKSAIFALGVFLVLFSHPLNAQNRGGALSSPTPFQDFQSLRTELLSRMGAATEQIILCSDFLTDADIVSSLYIAQYRKVRVSVLLGRSRATDVRSRLSYLQQVNIPTGIRPAHFFSEHPTMILIDRDLISINANLDYGTKTRKILLTTRSDLDKASFESQAKQALNSSDTPDAVPLPKVGRAGANRPTYSSKIAPKTKALPDDEPLEQTPPPPQAPYKNSYNNQAPSNQPFRYKPVREKPSQGVPTKLPKTPIYQERERMRAQESDPN